MADAPRASRASALEQVFLSPLLATGPDVRANATGGFHRHVLIVEASERVLEAVVDSLDSREFRDKVREALGGGLRALASTTYPRSGLWNCGLSVHVSNERASGIEQELLWPHSPSHCTRSPFAKVDASLQ